MTAIWRLNIKTASKAGVDPRRFCLDKGVLGVGWRVDEHETLDWDSYYQLANARYYPEDKGWWPAVNAVYNRMSVNDLCWTRDRDGQYYLGRIASEWRYDGSPDHVEADIINARDCEWFRVGTVDSVPGKVVNSFIPARTVQTVADDSVAYYSQLLFNKLSGNVVYGPDRTDVSLFSLASAEDCEDIVGAYLQEQGYRLIPSSCKSDTVAYEFVLKHRDSGRRAVVQVKQGVPIDLAKYESLDCDVFLFTTQGRYVGTPSKNIHCLSVEEMIAFALANQALLSDRLKNWMRYLADGTMA
tara:strand:- start:2020 stop:2916 length:897 start_codon:yes stop_codon:yes gene_type:complete